MFKKITCVSSDNWYIFFLHSFLIFKKLFREFAAQCFQPFSAALCKEGVYKDVEKEAQELLVALRDQVDK